MMITVVHHHTSTAVFFMLMIAVSTYSVSAELISKSDGVEVNDSTCPMACDQGYCKDQRCRCFIGYSGIKCNMQKCADGVCEQTTTCISNTECCSIVGCDRPLLFGNLSEDKNGNYLPPIAYVGVGLCAIFVLVGVAAMVMYGPCCGSGSQRQSASKYVVGAGKSVKKRPYRSTISSFIPAEDVTSEDNIGDLMTNWVRTESNAINEAPGVMLPYKPDTDDKAREAWEGPGQLLDETASLPHTNAAKTGTEKRVKSRTASERSATRSPAADSKRSAGGKKKSKNQQ